MRFLLLTCLIFTSIFSYADYSYQVAGSCTSSSLVDSATCFRDQLRISNNASVIDIQSITPSTITATTDSGTVIFAYGVTQDWHNYSWARTGLGCSAGSTLNPVTGACDLGACPTNSARDGNGQCICSSPLVMNGSGTACINPDTPPCNPPNTIVNGVCTAPDPICQPPQTLQNHICVNPTCTPPQTLQNGVCADPKPCPEGYEKTVGGWCAAKPGGCDPTSPGYDPIQCDKPPCQFGQRRAVDGNCYSPSGPGDGSGNTSGSGDTSGNNPPPDPSLGGADGCPDGQVKVNGVCANQGPTGGCPEGTSRGTVNGVDGCFGAGGPQPPPDPTPPDPNKPGVDGCPAGQVKVNGVCSNQAPSGGCPSGTSRGTVNGVDGCYGTAPGTSTGGSGDNKPPPVTGECDPTKSNYAECVGEVEKPDANAVQTDKNTMETVASDSIKNYGDTVQPKIEASESIDLSEANGSITEFLNVIPQPASCDASVLTFVMSGHVLQLDCNRFERLKVWFGWALWLMTIYACILISISKSSGA